MGRSHIIRRRESLVLYKSFNTLCPEEINFVFGGGGGGGGEGTKKDDICGKI